MGLNFLQSYTDNGYCIIREDGLEQRLALFQKVLLRLSCSYLNKELPQDLSSSSIISEINKNLLDLYNCNPDLLTNLQRVLTRSPEFFLISSSKVISNIVRLCLGVERDSALYIISNCVTFSFPVALNKNITSNFSPPWHDDIFWTIPESSYVHIWIPLLNDATEDIGTLKICEGSHIGEWRGRHQFHKEESFNYRYSVRESVHSKFNKKSISVKKGEILLFNQSLIHASGKNITSNVRVTMLGMFHDASKRDFKAPTPNMKFVNKTPEQYYYEIYRDESILDLAKEQLDLSNEPPGGI